MLMFMSHYFFFQYTSVQVIDSMTVNVAVTVLQSIINREKTYERVNRYPRAAFSAQR